MANVTVQIPKRSFNDVYLPLLYNKSRYLVLYGGAGSGKSVFIVQRYIYKMLNQKKCNIIVVRATANSNRTSTFALFKQIINRWGMSKHFKVNESNYEIRCTLNKNCVVFRGLDDVEKLKSTTFESGEATDVWVEEASEEGILENDIDQLNIRLRGANIEGQIVISFNPVNVMHYLKAKYYDRAPMEQVAETGALMATYEHSRQSINGKEVVLMCTICKTTYKDNRFLDDAYKAVLESYQETDPYYYDVYCLGMWGVYGKTVFDAHKINARLAQDLTPIRTGQFLYDYDGINISNIRWEDDQNGYISIYQDPKQGHPYVVGGDTAGEGSDSFTGQCIDNVTGEQVATLRHQFDEDLYARQMYCLGMHYNAALLAIEVNFSTYPTKELQRLCYPKMFVRQQEDSYTGKMQQAFGFKTTQVTRPVIISGLVQIVRDAPELVSDRATLNEMLTFVRNQKGRPEAQQGAHDDLIMGLAIAHYARTQQTMHVQIPTTTQKVKWHSSVWEDYNKASEEDKRRIIEIHGNPF